MKSRAALTSEKSRSAAKALGASEARFRDLLNAAPDAAVIVDAEGRIVLVNEQTEHLFGYPREELIGEPVEILLPESFRDIHVHHRQGYVVDPKTRPMGAGLELSGLRKDGREFPVDISLSAISTEEGMLAMAYIRDTTARKADQAALRASEARFRSLLNSAPDAAVIVDAEGRIVLVNEQTEHLFGYPREELIGEPVEILLPESFRDIHVHHRQGYVVDPKTRPMGAGLELSGLRKDGREFPVDISLSALSTDQGTLAMAFIRDITDRKRVERELEAARDQALEASRLKSQFLANMSHEIRTPMNGILGMAQLLLSTELDDTQHRRLTILQESGLSLLALINDILDFSKVEAGRLDLERHDFDLLASIDGVIGLLSSAVDEKGLRLELEIDPDVPGWVRGDPLRLRQVLINLVGNAIKFTEKGFVRLTVRKREGGRLGFEIQDSGIGIQPADRERLMRPFSQGDASTTRRFGGTGLGLAISSELIAMMGGALEFASEPGVGTTFWFEVGMPAAEHPPSGRLVAADADAAVPSMRWPKLAPELARPGARILLVDDGRLNLEVGLGLLETAGYEVETATNGVEALEAMRRSSYDAVLMDCLMPKMDGYEATRRIKQLPGRAGKTPVIAVTAAALAEDRQKCVAAGMDDYLAKPLEAQLLLAMLARWVPVPRAWRDGPPEAVPPPAGSSVLGEQYELLVGSLPADVMQRVCEEFVSETPGLLSDLAAAVRRGERAGAKRLAHKLKGSASTMGAVGLSNLAERIEAGQDRSEKDSESLLEELEQEFGRVAAALGPRPS